MIVKTGELLKRMGEIGCSQTWLSRKIGANSQYVTHILGSGVACRKYLIDLAVILKCDLSDIAVCEEVKEAV